MLSEKPWKVEAVIRLMVGLVAGQLITLTIASSLSTTADGKGVLSNHPLAQFALNTLSFHGLALILLHFFLRYHGVGWSELLGLRQFRPRVLAWGIGGAAVILPVALLLNTFLAFLLTKLNVVPAKQPSMHALELSVTLGQKIVFGLAAVVMAPIAEESIFRGILYPMVKQEGYPRAALFGSSFVFAIIHLNFLTFLPLFVLALAFVFLVEATDTLITSILAHALFNAANMAIFLNDREITGWWNEIWRLFREALPF